MGAESLIARAAASAVEVVHGVRPEQLGARTPCTEYDVRGLVNHLLYWGPALELAGRKEPVRLPEAREQDIDLTEGDWAAALETQIGRLAEVWSRASAWDGTTSMGGGEMPAAMVGGMVLAELVAHGWDLAVATGQKFTCDDDVAEEAYRAVAGMAEQGRQMGVFGEEVPVPSTASPLDRALGITGRDPDWSA